MKTTSIKLIVFSSKGYPATAGKRPNSGDCTLIDTGSKLIVFGGYFGASQGRTRYGPLHGRTDQAGLRQHRKSLGKSSFEAIAGKLDDYSILQLPHHGKPETAQKIFEAKYGNRNTVYLISDNTGDTNGGSDKLAPYGKIVYTTRNGDIHYPPNASEARPAVRGTLGVFCYKEALFNV